ncbi:MAG TPA: hypothetical protein VFA95_08740 [Gammaproteobacteria bacterium]|nr:hypothetical protein [Gammaproteobacteria bacterium]
MSEPETTAKRSGKGRFFFSSDEQEQSGEGWYYKAREGVIGPFQTRDEAAEDLESLISANPQKRREIYRKLGIILGNLDE